MMWIHSSGATLFVYASIAACGAHSANAAPCDPAMLLFDIRVDAGSQPESVAFGHFDNDGNLDMAIANSGARSVSIRMGDGAGAFTAATSVLLPTSTSKALCVATADFDEDGYSDIAIGVGNDLPNDYAVSIWLCDGDGTFTASQNIKSGTIQHPECRYIHVGDFDQNSALDLAVAISDRSEVWVMLGDGDGTFGSPIVLASGSQGRYPYCIAGGDFDGQNGPDLAVVNKGQTSDTPLDPTTIAILWNDGTGAFTTATEFEPEDWYNSRSIVAGDFDQDGDLDLATLSHYGDTNLIGIYEDIGAGFQKSREIDLDQLTDNPYSLNPQYIAAGYFDGDNDLDLAISIRTSPRGWTWVLRGDSDDTFEAGQESTAGPQPGFVASSDIDGDGEADLVVTNRASDDVAVLRGRGDGTFVDEPVYLLGEQPRKPRSMVGGDFDGDGDTDVAVADDDFEEVTVLLSDGEGGFAYRDIYASGDNLTAIATGDFDSDGNLDLLMASAENNNDAIWILLGDGFGEFDPPLVEYYAVGANPESIAVGDFNSDGDLDVVVARDDYTDGFSLLLGGGDGAFVSVVEQTPIGNHPSSVTTGHFDSDSYLDIAVAVNDSQDKVWIGLGEGDGTFSAAGSPLMLGDVAPSCVASGDLDEDGELDLVVANEAVDNISIFLGDGDGTFGTPSTRNVGDQPKVAIIVDMNRDGSLDVVVSNYGSFDVSVLLGNGDGTFQAEKRFHAGWSP